MALKKPTAIAIGTVLLLFALAQAKSVWRKVDIGVGNAQLDGVAMSPNGLHIVTTISHSSDRGVTWELFPNRIPSIMAFGDNIHLFGVASSQGCNLPNGSAALYRSTDYGRTLEETPVQAPMCFNDVFFLDSLYGWAVGSWKDSVVITKDGGKTFVTRPFGFGYGQPSGIARFAAGGVSFLDSLNGFVSGWLVGTDSAVLRTTDGGNTWAVLPVGVPASVGGGYINFTDSLHGWLSASYGNGPHIFTSSDRGQTWTELVPPPHQELRQIKAFDSLRCWIIGVSPFPYGPRIWKTSDGGQNWMTEYDGPGGFLLDFDMADTVHGVAVGNFGTVLIYAPLILGDLNADEEISLADIVFELNKVFWGVDFPSPEKAGDLNCDALFSPSDVVLLLNRYYLNIPFPCAK
jgi:photosystem II stability/assembly factor-like uncharacterized protein